MKKTMNHLGLFSLASHLIQLEIEPGLLFPVHLDQGREYVFYLFWHG
jgi:hypothetical protein